MRIIYLFIILFGCSISSIQAQFLSEPFNYSADSTKSLSVQSGGAWATAKKPFTIIVMPDTQSYSKGFSEGTFSDDVFKAQTQWILDQADSIAFVLHLGDIVTNSAKTSQWDVAKAMYLLDGKVPYVVVTGNHDLGTHGNSDTRESDPFNAYFPYAKYSKTASFGGAYEVGKMDNTWHTFEAGGINWLVLALEFGPRNKILDWAASIIQQHPDHKVILDTHAYMYADDTRMGPGDKWLPNSYGLGQLPDGTPIPDDDPEHANDGEEIWTKLMSQYPNAMMVFSGHVLLDGTGNLVGDGVNGNKVYQMLSNYQNLVDVEYVVNGVVKNVDVGDSGFLRIVTIDPLKKTIAVKTYSPYIDMYLTAPDQQFVFENVSF